MKHEKNDPKHLDDICAERGPEDGIDPRLLVRSRSHRRKRVGLGRKQLQLAKQVKQALELEFAGASDDTLQRLAILCVDPSTDGANLRVIVTPADFGDVGPESAVDETRAIAALTSAAGHLRSVVASEIHRKRTPELSFRFVRSARPSDSPADQR